MRGALTVVGFFRPTLLTAKQRLQATLWNIANTLHGKASTDIPSLLLIEPYENRWTLTPQNSIHLNWEVLRWLSRYIGGTLAPKELMSEGAAVKSGFSRWSSAYSKLACGLDAIRASLAPAWSSPLRSTSGPS